MFGILCDREATQFFYRFTPRPIFPFFLTLLRNRVYLVISTSLLSLSFLRFRFPLYHPNNLTKIAGIVSDLVKRMARKISSSPGSPPLRQHRSVATFSKKTIATTERRYESGVDMDFLMIESNRAVTGVTVGP